MSTLGPSRGSTSLEICRSEDETRKLSGKTLKNRDGSRSWCRLSIILSKVDQVVHTTGLVSHADLSRMPPDDFHAQEESDGEVGGGFSNQSKKVRKHRGPGVDGSAVIALVALGPPGLRAYVARR